MDKFTIGSIILLYFIFIASGTYLVVTEHYWWAWIPFLFALGLKIEYTSSSNKNNGNGG